MKLKYTIAPRDHVGLVSMYFSGKLTTSALNFSQHKKDPRLEERVPLSMKSFCLQMVLILRFTQWAQITHMLRQENALRSMEKLIEMQRGKRFAILSILHTRKKISQERLQLVLSKIYAGLTC
jgi:hypothetical protein